MTSFYMTYFNGKKIKLGIGQLIWKILHKNVIYEEYTRQRVGFVVY
jgi:hypothetical protein